MSAVTFDQAATLALATGFPLADAPTMVAIMAAESGLDPRATCDDISIYQGHPAAYALAQQDSCAPANAHPGRSCGPGPWTSFGLGQVNLPAHAALLQQLSGSGSPCAWAHWLYVPANNVAACLAVWRSAGFGAWTTYQNGTYRAYLSQAQAAVTYAAQVVLPPAHTPTTNPPATGNGSTTAQQRPTPPSLLFILLFILGGLGLATVGGVELER